MHTVSGLRVTISILFPERVTAGVMAEPSRLWLTL